MRYPGGKAYIAGPLGAWLTQQAQGRPGYWEPFVGAAWVIAQVSHPVRRGSDSYAELIALLQALQGGYKPPSRVTEADYVNAWVKATTGMETPRETFIAHACAFGGGRFAGYAREGGRGVRDYAREASRQALRLAPRLRGVELEAHSFDAWTPPEPGWLVYCDPPYVGTTAPGKGGAFPHRRFWRWAADLARQGHAVRVSELRAPRGWVSVWERRQHTGLRNGRSHRVERVFQLEGAP